MRRVRLSKREIGHHHDHLSGEVGTSTSTTGMSRETGYLRYTKLQSIIDQKTLLLNTSNSILNRIIINQS